MHVWILMRTVAIWGGPIVWGNDRNAKGNYSSMHLLKIKFRGICASFLLNGVFLNKQELNFMVVKKEIEYPTPSGQSVGVMET